MAHFEQQNYCNWVKKNQPDFFEKTKVLDVGSLDINGNNRYLFDHCTYTGIDIGAGPNVDIIAPVHEYEKTVNSFLSKIKRGFFNVQYDVVISCEMLEHDKYWEKSLRAMYKLLRPGGLLIITAAGVGRAPHGTAENSPNCSPFTNGYYKNVTDTMLVIALKPDLNFIRWDLKYNTEACDVYFSGIKK